MWYKITIIFSIAFLSTFSIVSGKTCSDIQHTNCIEITDCRILDLADSYYLLMNDVSSQGSCFWFSGENIILDLNGYTVYYDQIDIPSIPNGNFETDDMTGWDLTGAPGWEIISELKSIGNRTLHLPNVAGSTVLSPAFQVPVAGHTYVASTFLNGLTLWPELHNLTIEFVRNDTGEPLGCGYGLPEMRYNSVLKDGNKELVGITCDHNFSDTLDVRIRITTDGPMLIDYVDFRGFLHPAIVGTNDYIPAHQYYSDKPDSITNTIGTLEARNGRIVQGNARSGKAIVGYKIGNFILEDLEIIMQDTPNNKGIMHIGYYGQKGLTHKITNITLEVPTVGVFKRDYIGAALILNGPSNVSYNTIRTDTAGIYINPKEDDEYIEGVLVSNNKIEMGFTQASMARNHYAIWVAAFDKTVIRNNILTGQGQGGINLAHSLNGMVYNNTVEIKPRCGLRFGADGTNDRLNVAGLVIRDNPDESETPDRYSMNNHLFNNNITVIVDPALKEPDCRVRAMAFWERNRYGFNHSRCGNNSVYNNTFTAINLDEELNSLGTPTTTAAMAFESLSPTMKEFAFNNTVQSNNILLLTNYEETYDRGVLVRDNFLIKLNTPEIPAFYRTRPFENVLNWDRGGMVFRDNIWINTDKYDYWKDGHTGSLKSENTLTLFVIDNESTPITNANVIINDSSNLEVFSGTTDQGLVQTFLTDFEVFGYNNDAFYNPHLIKVSYGDSENITTRNVNESTYLILTLNTATGYHPADSNQDGCISDPELSNFITIWKLGNAPMPQLIDAIRIWKVGCS